MDLFINNLSSIQRLVLTISYSISEKIRFHYLITSIVTFSRFLFSNIREIYLMVMMEVSYKQ